MKLVKTFLFAVACSTSLIAINSYALDVHFTVTSQDGKKTDVFLSGYDASQAVVSSQTDFCSRTSSVTTWTKALDTKLIVNGSEYLINGDDHFETFDPNVGTLNKFYYSVYSFKDSEVCEQVFKHESSIHENDLSSMKLSFVHRPANVDYSLAQVQLQLNFNTHQVFLWMLKNGDKGANMFDPANWELAGIGTF